MALLLLLHPGPDPVRSVLPLWMQKFVMSFTFIITDPDRKAEPKHPIKRQKALKSFGSDSVHRNDNHV